MFPAAGSVLGTQSGSDTTALTFMHYQAPSGSTSSIGDANGTQPALLHGGVGVGGGGEGEGEGEPVSQPGSLLLDIQGLIFPCIEHLRLQQL